MAAKHPGTEVLTDKYNRFSVDLPQRIKAYDIVWDSPAGPSAYWMDGAPLGNGDFGALAYGYPDNFTFALGKTDLWVRLNDRSSYPAGTYDDVRDAYDNQDSEKFAALQQSPTGLGDVGTSHTTTAGVFRLHVADASVLADCTQRVSLYDAVMTCNFRTLRIHGTGTSPQDAEFSITSFCSRGDDVLVVRVDTPDIPLGQISMNLRRQVHPALSEAESKVAGDVMLVEQELLKGDGYVLAARVIDQPAGIQTIPRGVWAECDCKQQGPLTVLVTIVSRRDADDPAAEAVRRLDAAAKKGYDALLADHLKWWHDFWQRSIVTIDDAAAEKWWYVSNYLAGSNARPGKLSPGLQGVWIKDNVPAWAGDFHGNINIQSCYWGLLGGNRVDLMEPYFSVYNSMLEQCRKETAEYFKMRGVRIPHACSVDGLEMTDPSWFVLGVHVAVSGWVALPFWQYYQYTQDEKFLRETAWPIISGVATFYSDFVRWDDAAGQYVIEPSVAYEGFCPLQISQGRNSNFELSFIHMMLKIALDAAEVLGENGEFPQLWRERLDKLAPLPIDEQGAWATWEGKGAVGDTGRVCTPFVTPIFPCGLASAFHGENGLMQQAAASWLDYHRRFGINRAYYSMGTGLSWCGGSPVATAAAMGDADTAIIGARWTDEQCAMRNGLVAGWDTNYLVADHGPGMALALNSMMLQELGGVLHIFEAVPVGMDARFHSMRAAGGFLMSAERREGKTAYVIIESLAGKDIRIASPFDPAPSRARPVFKLNIRVRDLETGDIVTEKQLSLGELIEWKTQPGKLYVMEDTDKPLESWPEIQFDDSGI